MVPMPKKRLDLIIIGGGPAGLSAAMWADEVGLSSILLDESHEPGGQLLYTYNKIENHLGQISKNGLDLRDRFLKQLSNRKLDIRSKSKVSNVDVKRRAVVLSDGTSLFYRALILATGVTRRVLDIPEEDRFTGSGILLSGKLQAKEAIRKTAVVVGGGDAAFENALILSEFAERVFLIHRRSEFSARPEFIEKVEAAARIDILTDSIVTGLEGKETLRTVKVQNPTTKQTRRIAAEILIIRIGVVPNADLLSETVAADERGYIQINSNCRTSVDSIYAVGDVANPHAPTISSAVGMGAIAVKSISSKR